MKRTRRAVLLGLVIILSLLVGSCKTTADAIFLGLWLFTSGAETEQMDITRSSFNILGGDSWNGTVQATVDSFDEDAGHIQTTITSTTGWYSGWSGTVYWSYAVVGNLLYLAYSSLSYPANAMAGVAYTRQ